MTLIMSPKMFDKAYVRIQVATIYDGIQTLENEDTERDNHRYCQDSSNSHVEENIIRRTSIHFYNSVTRKAVNF